MAAPTVTVAGMRTAIPMYRPGQVAKLPPCQAGCAVGGTVRDWVQTVAQRRQLGIDDATAYERAWRLITDRNPFPAVLGRICPHPCEAGCNRSDVDDPVAINALERFLGDWAIGRELSLARLDETPRAESIGVVGSGPSGLSFAYQMARRGYPVTVYEQHAELGGMLRFGVPAYRLPKPVLDAEIRRIGELGVEMRTGTRVGRDVSMEELRDRHALVYVGIGAQQGRPLGVPGEAGPGVISGIEYLARVNRGGSPAVGDRIVVVGGGNTAVDSARVARRGGAEVVVMYRRTGAEMPAVDGEVADAIEEGVEIRYLTAPVEIVRADGAVTGIVARRMSLGSPDASGRRRPEPIDGSDHTIPADAVIAAVSQFPDWSSLGEIALADTGRGVTEVDEQIWVGGDATGPDIAGIAIAHGRSAAEAAHARLSGTPLSPAPSLLSIPSDRVKIDYRPSRRRAAPARLSPQQALGVLDREVSVGIDEAAFLAEVERCASCGLCFGCAHCFMYCTVQAFGPVAAPELGDYFTMDLDQCLECGKCVEVCPSGFLEVLGSLR